MNIIMTLLGVLGAVYGLWFVVIAVLGCLKKYEAPAAAAPKTRFAVLIPARNERNVVGYLVRNMLAQKYPRELFDVIVIPNNCSDDTADIAREAGARVLECTVPVKSKGDVLRFTFDALKADGYDAYCILDADNLASDGFLAAANNAICDGMDIAQGFRDSKNPLDGWVAGDTSIFFWIMNKFYYRARVALGLSAALNGTGIVISRSLVDRLGWNMVTLTEDLEYTGLCAAESVKIGFLEDAIVYDEQPVGIWDSIVQRRRWFKGGMQCFRVHAAALAKRHSLHCIDMLMVFGGWVMMLTGIFSGAVTIWNILTGLIGGSIPLIGLIGFGAAALALVYGACVLAAWAVCRVVKKRVTTSAIIMFPIFLVTWGIANLWALVTPAPGWQQIAHVRGTDRPD